MADITVTAPEIQALKDKATKTNSLMFDVISLLHAARDIVETLPDDERDPNGLTTPITRLVDVLSMGIEKSTAAINALDV